MKRSHQKRNKSGPNHRKDKVSCISRKANRKADRKKKKERMNQKYLQRFSKIKPSPEILEETTQKKEVTTMRKGLKEHTARGQKTESVEKRGPKKSTPMKEKRTKVKPTTEKNTARNKSPVEDAVMARERKQLAQLEKKLRLKKRAKLPRSFQDDGLDYLLDAVDSSKLYDDLQEEELYGLQQEREKPLKKVKEKNAKKESHDIESKPSSKHQTKRVHFQLDGNEMDSDSDNEESDDVEEEDEEEDDEEMHSESEQEEEGDDGTDDDEVMTDEEEADDDDESEDAEQMEDEEDQLGTEDEEGEDNEVETDNVREDIYGRLIDSKGNLVSNIEQSKAYIPPAKRAALLAGSEQESIERLKKQMKGLLNRASESNMQDIAKSIEELYMHHSRASVNQSLFTLIKEAVVSPVLTPARLVAEMAMLVAILHGNVGSEVGAYVLQHVVKEYEELRHQEKYGGEEHTMDNVVLLLCYLYNFKVAHHALLFEVISQFVDSFTEKDIELLLLVLKAAGFYLRRDDPEALGNQITAIQQKAGELEKSGVTVPSRVRFMLEVLVAVRNNNVRRVPGADTERTDRLRQLAGKFVRGGSLADNQLKIGLRDLLQADHKGRWWIVGSAWEGRLDSDSVSSKAPTKGSGVSSVVGAVSPKLVHLAKKLRINSDLRRSIFYVLMSSEDYEDAFQKVLQLGLKGQQQQEIVVVAVLCCRQESSYNPFYSFLLQKLASHERRFMIAIQFHMWDMFKTMEELSTSSRKNLAAMLAHLLASKALSLSVLKVLEFGVLSKAVVKFLKHVFTTLLTTTPVSELKDIFRAIAQLQKFRTLADGLQVFLVKHVQVEGEEKKKLVQVCNELSHNHQMLM